MGYLIKHRRGDFIADQLNKRASARVPSEVSSQFPILEVSMLLLFLNSLSVRQTVLYGR